MCAVTQHMNHASQDICRLLERLIRKLSAHHLEGLFSRFVGDGPGKEHKCDPLTFLEGLCKTVT